MSKNRSRSARKSDTLSTAVAVGDPWISWVSDVGEGVRRGGFWTARRWQRASRGGFERITDRGLAERVAGVGNRGGGFAVDEDHRGDYSDRSLLDGALVWLLDPPD